MKTKEVNGKKLFMCEECNFYYKDKKWVKKCENYCKKHKSCNPEITKYSIGNERGN